MYQMNKENYINKMTNKYLPKKDFKIKERIPLKPIIISQNIPIYENSCLSSQTKIEINKEIDTQDK